MSRYTEKKYTFKFDNPYDLIRILISFLFMSPFRLLNEISKKVLFTGKYTLERILLSSIVINTALIVITVLYSLFISKRIYLTGNSLPLVSLVISLGMCIGTYFLIANANTKIFSDYINYSEVDLSVVEETKTPPVKDNLHEIPAEDKFDIELDIMDSSLPPVNDAISFVEENRKACMREDEFVELGDRLNNAVEDKGSELDDLLSRFMSGDNLSPDLNIEESEDFSQSLHLYDLP